MLCDEGETALAKIGVLQTRKGDTAVDVVSAFSSFCAPVSSFCCCARFGVSLHARLILCVLMLEGQQQQQQQQQYSSKYVTACFSESPFSRVDFVFSFLHPFFLRIFCHLRYLYTSFGRSLAGGLDTSDGVSEHWDRNGKTRTTT